MTAPSDALTNRDPGDERLDPLSTPAVAAPPCPYCAYPTPPGTDCRICGCYQDEQAPTNSADVGLLAVIEAREAEIAVLRANLAERDERLATLPGFDGDTPPSADRLGRAVREEWLRWARRQPNPKPSWLVAYDDLSEADQDADRQIGNWIYLLAGIRFGKRFAGLASAVRALDDEVSQMNACPFCGGVTWRTPPQHADTCRLVTLVWLANHYGRAG